MPTCAAAGTLPTARHAVQVPHVGAITSSLKLLFVTWYCTRARQMPESSPRAERKSARCSSSAEGRKALAEVLGRCGPFFMTRANVSSVIREPASFTSCRAEVAAVDVQHRAQKGGCGGAGGAVGLDGSHVLPHGLPLAHVPGARRRNGRHLPPHL